MADALYGDNGFYLASGAPARGFRTAAHASSLWSTAILELAGRVAEGRSWPDGFQVVDVGAGGGELLAALAETAPASWQLVGVDYAPRPVRLPPRVQWRHDPPTRSAGLLLAVELLDVVPVEVVELTDAGVRVVEVADDGEERLSEQRPAPADAAWLDRWWPLRRQADSSGGCAVGDRAEVGRPRDAVWRSLVATMSSGLAVMVDYAAAPARDVAGTLTGFRDGRQVAPVPDGRHDLTAHVLVESLVDDGDLVTTQRAALRALGVSGARPSYGGDPTSYLRRLSAAGEAAELLDESGLGGFSWLLHEVRSERADGAATTAPTTRA